MLWREKLEGDTHRPVLRCYLLYLGAFVKLRKAHGTSRFSLDGFSWNLIFEYFSKNECWEISIFIQSGESNMYFTWRPIPIFYHIWLSSSRDEKPLKILEKIKTHVSCSKTCVRKSCSLKDKVEESWRAGQATEDNMAHTRCMRDN